MKKEIINKSERIYMGDGQYMTRGNCPNCNEPLYTYSHRFVMFEKCPVCNQELDWGKKRASSSLKTIIKGD